MTDIIECKTILDIDFAAQKVFNTFNATNRIFAFYGLMGVGKTTFIKAICKYMGVKDIVNSPTFAIVNEYKANQYGKIYHFDFYRIKTIAEVYDMGYEDYFYSRNYCFIEWPEKIAPLLPKDFVSLTIKENNGIRSIIF
ncbi:MAG: tRNA (adenosine(37)-N6)-threonylcarbamoyltransferase complex ATPase subunit type 1 TsaE [Bacteroidetes bacterium CG2_30_32_10]|nr:MAG: tRNA (adenosine(37)-N6)-threonylcarbamoyltransferase complex ATPase subunit type 1 TsaE [Bacteroidetes bacterium CG2_30_32_10]